MLVIADLFKTFVDCESYNSGHGHAYDTYQIDKTEGAAVVVRPDHCMISIFMCIIVKVQLLILHRYLSHHWSYRL